MLSNINIGPRMAGMIIIGAGLILATIIAYSYFTARGLLLEELEAKARYMALSTAHRIEIFEKSVEKIAQGAARTFQESDGSKEAAYRLLHRVVEENDEVFGSAIAFNPEGHGSEKIYSAPYVHRKHDQLIEKDIGEENYRYDVWDWFTLPRDMGQAIWTEPYFDEGGGNALMVTYAVPVYRKDDPERLWAVVTCDVSLDWVSNLLGTLRLGPRGYAMLISENGRFISHVVREFIMNETVYSVAESRNEPELRVISHLMRRGGTGFIEHFSPVLESPCWMAFATIPKPGWVVALVFPRENLMEKVIDLSRSLFVLGIIGFTLLLIIGHLIAQSIVQPLQHLTSATRALAGGNLDAVLPKVQGTDEVACLATSFSIMQRELKEYMAQLQATTAAKERIEGELHVAHSIQMSLVPKTFPPFPERKDLEIYAMLDPAREIGGDFYDFFMPDEDTLCLIIGDVSGKGVPAALFMAVTRTFLKSIWRDEGCPARVLQRLNDELSQDNESNMFVTLFCATIHLSSGACHYARGGHNPPFLIRSQGQVDRLPWVKGAIVGAIPGGDFEEGQVTLLPGDTLFLYTDGVTEGMNPDGEVFGENRTMAALSRNYMRNCRDLLLAVRESLNEYIQGAEQSDDITMMVFQYQGENDSNRA